MEKKLDCPIFITGTLSSGKGIVAKVLKEHFKYEHISLREQLIQYAESIGVILSNRDELRLFANVLRRDHGGDFLLKRLEKKILFSKIVIESVRTPAEIDYIRSLPKALLVSVDAPRAVRYSYAKKRRSITDNVSLHTFTLQEEQEFRGNAIEQNIPYCMNAADVSFMNSGTVSELRMNVLSHFKAMVSD